jgi:hypothetical protein
VHSPLNESLATQGTNGVHHRPHDILPTHLPNPKTTVSAEDEEDEEREKEEVEVEGEEEEKVEE